MKFFAKWIFIQIVFTSFFCCALEAAEALSERDIEMMDRMPQETYVYIPENIKASLGKIENLLKTNTDIYTQTLLFYLQVCDYNVAPYDLVQKSISHCLPLLEKQNSRLNEIQPLRPLIDEMQQYQQDLKNDAVVTILNDQTSGPRYFTQLEGKCKRNKQKCPCPPGPAGPPGPPGPPGMFPAVVLDTSFSIVDAVDPTMRLVFDVQGTAGTTTTLITNPTVDRNFITPDITGTALVSETGTEQVFIGGPTTTLHGSNAGIQYSTIIADRARERFNQYGNHIGAPGITTFKSRAAAIGGIAPVAPGDQLLRDEAFAVSDNLSIPLTGHFSFVVPPGGVPAGQAFVATDYDLQLTPLAGPAERQVLRVTSEGILHIRETANSMAGVVTLAGAGTALVANTQITATSRIMLTIQDGGTVPTGFAYVSARTAGTNFTITSSGGAADNGVVVYYQIWEPTTP